MKPSLILYLLLFVGITSSWLIIQQDDFNLLKQAKTGLGREGAAEFFFWEFQDQASVWSNAPKGLTAVQSFQDSLEKLLGVVQFQRVVKKEQTQRNPKDSMVYVKNGDHYNAMLVHTGAVGKVRPMNSLEAQILNYQLEKYPLLTRPTEFHAFIAYHQERKAYRVYFGSSDQPWPPKPVLLIHQLEEDIKNGWKLRYHLHNHYEPPENNYLGILAPSMADAQYYKMLADNYQIEQTLITNGIHTVEIKAADFGRFEKH
jgi:hypothetical protein